MCSLLSDAPERGQVAVQQGAAFLPISTIRIATGSRTLVLGAGGELAEAQPSTNTQPTAQRCFFCSATESQLLPVFSEDSLSPFSLAFGGAAGSRDAQRPSGGCFTFLSPNVTNVLAASEPGERPRIMDGTAAALNKRDSQVSRSKYSQFEQTVGNKLQCE